MNYYQEKIQKIVLGVFAEKAGTQTTAQDLAAAIAERLTEQKYIPFSGVLGFEATRPDPA